jgi:DNA modification methylase
MLTYPNDYINKVVQGNCVEVMCSIPDDVIDIVVSSPPYGEIRAYKGYIFDYKLVAKELFRVTKPGGVVVWVVGDETIKGSRSLTSFEQALYFKNEAGFTAHDIMIYEKNGASFPARKDGNRYTNIYEWMFVFSKGKPKTTNLICDKKNAWAGYTSFGKHTQRGKDGILVHTDKKPTPEFSVRNNIWRYNTGRNYSTKDEIAFKHPAIFPEELAEDHIKTWSNPGDIVLDPMCGSGTTLKMAKVLSRNFIGIDISEEYCEIARERVLNAQKRLLENK